MSSRSSILSSPCNEGLLNPKEPLDGGGELFDLLVRFQSALLDGLPDAVLDVVLEQDGRHLLGGRDDAPYLGEDVHAVRLFFYHALYSANLPLYPLETVLQLLLVSLSDVPVFPYRSFPGRVPRLLHSFLPFRSHPTRIHVPIAEAGREINLPSA